MASESTLADRVRESAERTLAQREGKARYIRERQLRLGHVEAPEVEAGIEGVEELKPDPQPEPTPEPQPEPTPEPTPEPVPPVTTEPNPAP